MGSGHVDMGQVVVSKLSPQNFFHLNYTLIIDPLLEHC